MGIRDQELSRLVSYIKGLGLKVVFSSKKADMAASWTLDNSQITVYKSKNSSKIETILSLHHELGHAIHNIQEKNRQTDPKFEEALNHVDSAEELGFDSKKRQRKIILDNEIAGSQYWHSIYEQTNMKFPIWRLECAMEFDLWQYRVFYETGDFPISKLRKAKYKELVRKYKK